MFGMIKTRVSISVASISLLAAFLAVGTPVHAQAAKNLLGSVSAINGDTLTVKNAQGQEQPVQVPSTAAIKRIEPGQTDLSKAVPLQFGELAVGDHVLISIDPNSAAGTAQALRVIAIKAADVSKAQQAQSSDWQKRGVGGLIKSVDGASGDIVASQGAGPTAKTITIHTAKTTILKRYAPASINYASAQAAPFSAIQAGDQLMARGTKSADGTQMTAEEVVTGSFRNISGTISSLDASSSTLVVKDLATKKQVTIHVPADAQMKKLADRTAQMLAARLKGTAAGGGGGRGGAGGGGGRGGAGGDEGAGQAGGQGSGGPGAGGQEGGQRGGGGGNMDPQQILSRAPAIHFADLQKGDAVMLVSSAGSSDVTAITLLAGVEPILEAPAGQDLLSNWSMGGGGEGGGTE